MPEVIFNGPEGRLEGRYQHGRGENPPVALVLHPHPQHGGNMNNKVVYSVFHVFTSMGFSTLRFNFRGVGRSQGEYDFGTGELSDAASALDWMQSFNADARACWISGFSFGAWIAMHLLMRRPEINGFICVSPPANLRDFNFLAPCPSPGLIVHGDKDVIASFDSARILSDKLQKQKKTEITFKSIKGADHFYENHKKEFISVVDSYIKKELNNT